MAWGDLAAGEILTAQKYNSRGPITLIKSSDQGPHTGTTLQDISDLAWTGEANAVYRANVMITYSATSAATNGRDIVINASGPVGCEITRKNIAYDDSADAGALAVSLGRPIVLRQRGAGTSQEIGGTGPTNFNSYYEWVVVNMGATAGTIKWQFAQFATSAGTSATIRAKSFIEYWRV